MVESMPRINIKVVGPAKTMPGKTPDDREDKILEMLVALEDRLRSIERLTFSVCLVVGFFMVTILFRVNMVSYKAEYIALSEGADKARDTLSELVTSYYWSSQFFFLAAVCYLFATYYRGMREQEKLGRMLEVVSGSCFAIGGLTFVYAGFRLNFVQESMTVFIGVLLLAFIGFQVALVKTRRG